MNEDVKQKVAKLLNEASRLLDPQANGSGSPSVNNSTQRNSDAPSGSSSASNSSSLNNSTQRNSDAPSGSSSASTSSSLGETLQRAQSMLQASSSAGLFRRLNRNERLRASSPYQQNRQAKPKPVKQKIKKQWSLHYLDVGQMMKKNRII